MCFRLAHPSKNIVDLFRFPTSWLEFNQNRNSLKKQRAREMGIRPLPITSRQELIRDTRLIYSPLIALPQLERNRSGNNPPPRPSWRNWPFFLLWKGFWRAKGSPFSSWTKDINGGLTRRTNEGSARRRWPNKEERRLPRCQSGRNPRREDEGKRRRPWN